MSVAKNMVVYVTIVPKVVAPKNIEGNYEKENVVSYIEHFCENTKEIVELIFKVSLIRIISSVDPSYPQFVREFIINLSRNIDNTSSLNF